MIDSREVFKKNLKNLYETSGLTLVELGRKLDVSYVQARRYVEGLSSPPFEMIDKICNIFGVKVSDLFSEKNTPVAQTPKMDPFEALEVLKDIVNERYSAKTKKGEPEPIATFWNPPPISEEIPQDILEGLSKLDPRVQETAWMMIRAILSQWRPR